MAQATTDPTTDNTSTTKQTILKELNQLIKDASTTTDKLKQNPKELPNVDASEIVKETLYLGSFKAAIEVDELESLSIFGILNCAGKGLKVPRKKKQYSDKFTRYTFSASDNSDYQIIEKHHKEAFQFLDKCAQNKTKTLVHCMSGINRSATIVVGYLIYKGYNLFDATKIVVSARPWILNNESFKLQLIQYASELKRIGNGFDKANVSSRANDKNNENNENINEKNISNNMDEKKDDNQDKDENNPICENNENDQVVLKFVDTASKFGHGRFQMKLDEKDVNGNVKDNVNVKEKTESGD